MATRKAQQPPPDPRREVVRLMEQLSRHNGHGAWRIFTDFVEMAAVSISNAVDLREPLRQQREDEYLRTVKKYDADDVKVFPEILAHLTMALEMEMSDILGSAFHELELHNKWAGQFFSPYNLCRMMAAMTVHDADKALLANRGYFTAMEPACGSGAMVIAIADELRNQKINYQQALHVTAVDVDIKCVHMAYLQFSLLHIPAVVVHGNSLTLEEHSHWYTPAHILGGWNWKLKRDRIEQPAPLELPPTSVAIVADPEPARPTKAKRGDQLTLF